MNEETFAILSILVVGVLFRVIQHVEDWWRERRE